MIKMNITCFIISISVSKYAMVMAVSEVTFINNPVLIASNVLSVIEPSRLFKTRVVSNMSVSTLIDYEVGFEL